MPNVRKIISIIFISFIVKVFIELKIHRYYVMEDELITEYGIITKKGYKIRYENIKIYSETIKSIDKILNTSTVNITVDEGSEFTFRYVPRDLAVELDNQIQNTQELEQSTN